MRHRELEAPSREGITRQWLSTSQEVGCHQPPEIWSHVTSWASVSTLQEALALELSMVLTVVPLYDKSSTPVSLNPGWV